MRNNMERRLILNGLPRIIKCKSIGFGLFAAMCDALISGRAYANLTWQVRAKMRAAIVTHFLAVGRAVETGLMTYNTSYWSEIFNAIMFNWMELKTARQKLMGFLNDQISYKFDYFNAHFFYLITGEGATKSKEQFVFPSLAANEGRDCSMAISKIFKDIAPYVEGTVLCPPLPVVLNICFSSFPLLFMC
jgi:hypothetical protein